MRTKLALLLLASAALHAANLPHGSVELLSKYNSAARTGPLKLGLHFQLEPGWHIYWKNPGDAGQAPRIHWTSPAGVDGGEIDWPAPDRLTAGPLVDFGYERDVLLPMSLDVPAGALNEKRLELRGEVRALICREVCIPGRAEVSLSVPVQDDAPAANPKVAALFNRAESRLPVEMPSSWRLSAAQSGDQILLRISGTSVAAGAMFFPGSANQVEYGAPQRSEQRGADFRLNLVTPRNAKGPVPTLDGILRLPQDSSPAAYLIRTEVSQVPPASGGGSGPARDSLLVMTLFALAGGLIPAPALSAYFISGLEFAGGFFLILGLGSRLIALPLFSIFSDPDKFTGAAPYTLLVASLIVLIFGPGKASVDAFLTARLSPDDLRRAIRHGSRAPAELSGPMWQHGLNAVRQEGAQTL